VVLKEGVQEDPTAVAREHARGHGAEVLHTYQHAIKGYAARLPERRLEEVRSDERVAYVERDQTAQATAQTLPWGINRIDADASSTKAGNGSGAVSNVNAYVIDSGIYKHADLRVVKHVNFVGDGKNYDCYGHGTHVAGTVAAKDNSGYVVGVAPGAPLTGVKVLDCNGNGSYSGIIKGVDWVTANAVKPAVANMSLGGGASQALDDAVRKSAAGGVFYSLAAGNEGADACKSSPARVGAGTDNGIATVAATNKQDAETSWSNYGRCVDVWAPGTGILSTKKGGGTFTIGGTSMAAPHVGGGAALYLSKNTAASPAAVEGAITSSAKTTASRSKDGAAILREYVGGF
jgi:subtilisin family serine protease